MSDLTTCDRSTKPGYSTGYECGRPAAVRQSYSAGASTVVSVRCTDHAIPLEPWLTTESLEQKDEPMSTTSRTATAGETRYAYTTIARFATNNGITCAAAGDVAGELNALARIIERAETLTAVVVKDARSDGLSWAQIGEALGMSRQAAWEKYGKTKSPKPPQVETLI